MREVLTITNQRRIGISLLAGIALCLQTPLTAAQDGIDVQGEEKHVKEQQGQYLPIERRSQFNNDAYILGPGDGLQIELLDLPELSGRFSIGPDGSIYLPRLRAIHVEGLTVEELRDVLTEQFSTYVRDPQVSIRPVVFRPIRIYVGGEVRRPGYYTLGGINTLEAVFDGANIGQSGFSKYEKLGLLERGLLSKGESESKNGFSRPFVLPTVFDAIRTAEGITPYSDLSNVQVTRKRALGLGGGRVRTNLNFISLITDGNESQNIRLSDGDVVRVAKSTLVTRDQLLKAGQTNLSPRFMDVFVSGRVKKPGGVVVPQAAVLNQAIALAGGPLLLRGKIEFIRFSPDGEVNRSVFTYDPSAPANAPNNPILMAGDLINIRETPLSMTSNLLSEFTTPIVGAYSIYSIFNSLNQ